MIGESLKVGGNDALQLLAGGPLFRRHDGVEERVVGNKILEVYPGAIIKVDFDFTYLAVDHLEPRADVDSLFRRPSAPATRSINIAFTGSA